MFSIGCFGAESARRSSSSRLQAAGPLRGAFAALAFLVVQIAGLAASSAAWAQPTISSVSRTAGKASGAEAVQFSGSGFTAVTQVLFGSTPAPNVYKFGDGSMIAVTPAGTGTVAISVVASTGTTAAGTFTYHPAPTITSFTPTSGPASNPGSIVITGSNFTNANSVSIGQLGHNFTIDSDTQITAQLGAQNAGTVGKVYVNSIGGQGVSAADFTYAYESPTLTSVTRQTGGVAGGFVQLTGTNLRGATAVTFGGVPATIDSGNYSNSNTSLAVTAPAHAVGWVDVVVTTPGGSATLVNGFKYSERPVITSLSPTRGPVGSTVTVTGTNLTGAISVSMQWSTSFTVVSDTQLTLTVPATSGTRSVSIETGAGSTLNTAADDFEVVAATQVTSLSDTTGPALGGNTVTITGQGFADVTAVTFGGVAATSWTVNSSSSISAIAPAGSGTVAVAVTGAGGPATLASAYTYQAAPAPTVSNVSSVAVDHDVAKAIDLASAISGSYTSIAIGTLAAHGTTSISGSIVTYTPSSGYYGADSFTFTATGAGGTSAPATVSLTVAAPAAPAAAGRTGVAVSYGAATAIDLSSAITGVASSIAIASAPAKGAVSIAGQVVTYTPSTGEYGADSFTYTATGPGGTSSAATVSLTIANPPAPVAANRTGVSAVYGGATAIDLAASISGVASSVALGAGPTNGTASIAGLVVSYTPTAGYYGADSFTFTATGPGGTSNTATVSLTVATPGVPAAATRSVAVAHNTAAAIDLSTSVSGVYSSLAVGTAPTEGVLTLSGSTATYTPNTGYFGADSFTYTATGPGGASAPATVTLTVAAPGAPTAAARAVSTPFGVAVAIDLSNSVTGAYSSLAVAAGPAKGAVTVSGATITYTPSSGASGADSFTYTATGAGGTSSPATVSVTIGAAAPVASAASLTVAYQGSATIDLGARVSGSYTTVRVTTPPGQGAVSVSGAQATYTPAAGYLGADSFAYVAEGPGGTSPPATVSVTVSATRPTASDTALATDFETPVTVDLASRAGGLFTGIRQISQANHGVVSFSGASATYTPTTGFSGTDQFTFAAVGAGGDSAPATVTITVRTAPPPQVSAPPQAAPAMSSTVTTTEPANINLSSLVSGPFTEIVITDPPKHGTVMLERAMTPQAVRIQAAPAKPAIAAVYTPNPGYRGPDSFAFAAVGPGGTSAPAVVAITVTGPPPVLKPIAASTPAGATATVDLTAAASEGPFTGAAIVSLSPAAAGAAILVAGGTANARTYRLEFTPDKAFSGVVTVTYSLTNSIGTSTSTVAITVQPRANPAADAEVRGLSDAQADLARRFATAQIANFQRRGESLHGGGGGQTVLGFAPGVFDLAQGDRERLLAGRGGRAPAQGADDDPIDRLFGRLTPEQEIGAFVQAQADGRAGAEDPSSGPRPLGRIEGWAAGSITLGRREGGPAGSGRAKFDMASNGLTVGADVKFSPRLALGVGGGGGRDVVEVGADSSRVEGRNWVAAAYGSARPADGVFVDAVAGVGGVDYDLRRFVAANGVTVVGRRDGELTFASLSTALERPGQGSAQWAGYGRLDYAAARLGGYAETGDPLNALAFEARTVESVSSVLGGRFSYDHAVDETLLLSPRLRIEWRHEFQDAGGEIIRYADWLAGPAFATGPGGWASDRLSLGAGVAVRASDRWKLDLEFAGERAKDEVSATLRAQGSVKF